MQGKPPVRTLKRVVDVDARRTITSEELMTMPLETYQTLRRTITIRKASNAPRYFCEECGYPVYAPKLRTGPLWKHFNGAPSICPWWTGNPSAIDDVSRRQFHGQQESPLHHRVKHLIADLLGRDARVSDIAVDKNLVADDGSRRPDVRATFLERPLAFELQLSTTQIPIITGREKFYERHRRHLIWLAWNFEAQPLEMVRQSFLDIRTSHSGNLFSLDAETIAEGEQRGTLVFRAFWWDRGECRSKLVTLDDLHWPSSSLCYVVPPRHIELRSRWAALDPNSLTFLSDRQALYEEIFHASDAIRWAACDVHDEAVLSLLDLLVSFDEGRPVGSKQSNLTEVINTFLYAKPRRKYAKMAEYAARCSGQGRLFDRDSVIKKLDDAKCETQIGKNSMEAEIIRFLFPEWVAPR